MTDELLGLLGLAKKAGKLVLGEEDVAEAALAHKARLVLTAADAADNTVQRAQRAANEGNAPFVRSPLTKAQLGSAAGRASCAVLALTDVGFAAAVVKKLQTMAPDDYGALSEKLSQKAAKTVRRRREKLARQKAARSGKPWAFPPKELQE